VKSKFTPNQLLSIDDMMESLRELIFEVPGALERKYLVVVIVNNAAYVYRFADATNHKDALQRALRAHKAASLYPLPAFATCYVYGLCNDRSCDCGQLPRLITYVVDLAKAA